jgi:hypothetical protein
MGYSENDAAYEAEVTRERRITDANRYEEWLIELCTQLDNLGRVGVIKPKELQMWWNEKKIVVKQRLEREQEKARLEELKAGALNKLSEEEKAALGLNRPKKVYR